MMTVRTIVNDRVTSGTATSCDRSDGATTREATTVSCCVSLTEISVRVAIVTSLALIALIVIGWRRPGTDYSGPPSRISAASESESAHLVDESPRVGRAASRKVFHLLGLGSIAAFVGIVIALVVSLSIAAMVTALLSRL